MWAAAIAALLKKQYPPYSAVGGVVARRPAQPVGQRLAGEHGRRRGQRAVHRRSGRLVRARRQRRRGLEAPPAEAGPDRRRLDERSHPGPQTGQREHVRHHVVDRPDVALVLVPGRRQEAHQPGVVDGLDRPGAGRSRLGDHEPVVGSQRGPDDVGPAGVLERRLEPRRLQLVLGVVQPLALGGEDPHHRPSAAQPVASSSCSSRYSSRHLARCSLPDDVFGSVLGCTSSTSRGGRPQTSSVRWWMALADRVEVARRRWVSATTTTLSLPL